MVVSLEAFIVTALAASLIYFVFFKKGNKFHRKITKESDEPKSPFFRHMETATLDPVTGVVKGEIPSWLEGTLTRNGAGITKVGEYDYSHIFDGLAVLHRFHISKGKATYSNRALESDTYKKNMAAQRIVVGEFGTASFPDPCMTIFQRFQSEFSKLLAEGADGHITDNCCVNVAYYGDQLYAMTETNFVHQLNPEKLNSVRKTRINDYCAVNFATAHPHVLPDGSVLNMGSSYSPTGGNYCVVKIPFSFNSKDTSFKDAKVLAKIPFSSRLKPCYYHSFGLTSNERAIIVESPLRLNILHLIATGVIKKTFTDCIFWDPTLKTKIHVVSLKDGKVHPIVYETDPLFTFHHINAYEEDGQIVMDIAAYPRGDLVLNWTAENQSQEGLENNPVARRFVLPLDVPRDAEPGKNLVTVKDTTATATVVKDEGSKPRVFLTGQQLANTSIELPRINYKFNGQKYKFCYGASLTSPVTTSDFSPDSIVKVDVNTKEIKRWMEQGKSPSEPIFVADPKGTAEDDGVILSALLHRDQEAAVTLLVLNAKNLEEISRIEFKTAGSVTGTFHGQWAQNEAKIHTY